MVLKEIIHHKEHLVKLNENNITTYQKHLKPSEKSLYKALHKEKSAFICEIKPASPSRGLIRKDVNVCDIARIYAPFVDAISVLADEKYFGGSYRNVQKVSMQETCPILCKDVVVSPLQIYEARFFGADAVLLMLSVLDDETYLACEKIASHLKMDVITEVHTEQEMMRANKLKAKVIGINNRNLNTLEIDLKTTPRLLSLAPKDALLISESGFSKREQLLQLSGQVQGFLIGSSLMCAIRIDLALRELLFGRVKICGLTNALDAQVCYQHGAYYGGLNFSPLSKRCVTVVEAEIIKKDVPLLWGGVFVNQSVNEVAHIAQNLTLDFVQLHGDEDEGYLSELRSLLPKTCEMWKALRVKDRINMPHELKLDKIVLDSFSASEYGGTGKAFDWAMLKDIDARHDYILAGGINLTNVSAASALNTFAIDIASGVEDDDPRKKSLEKIKEIFFKLRP